MKRKKFKNILLITITLTMMILFFISMCFLDADSWIPLQVCVGSFSWLALFSYANRKGGYKEKDEYRSNVQQ